MIGQVIRDDVAAVLPHERLVDASPVEVTNRIATRSGDPLLDDVLGVVDVLVHQARGDLLSPSSLPVVLEGCDRRRAFLHFDELIQRIPGVGLRPIRGEIAIRVNGSDRRLLELST